MDKNEVQALIRESLAPLQQENKQLKEIVKNGDLFKAAAAKEISRRNRKRT